MATNLRLPPRTAAALRRSAAQSGRSQHDLLIEAVDRYLGLHEGQSDLERAVSSGLVEAPTPFQDAAAWIMLPAGLGSGDLLGRDDR